MFLRLIVAVSACMSLSSMPTASATAADPANPVLGRWLTRNHDGVFEIDRCDDTLCGALVGMRYTGSMPLDVVKKPQCHETLLTGFVPSSDPGRWTGHIVNPDSGHSYQATIWSPEPDRLKLRGYLLLPIFGETQSWTRYRGAIGAACKLP